MGEVNWALGMPQGGDSFSDAFERGQKMGAKIAERDALDSLSKNPEDPDSLRKLWRVNPELAIKVAGYQNDRAFTNASGEYFGNNALLDPRFGRQAQSAPHPMNALSMVARQQPAALPTRSALQPSMNALAPVRPGATFDEAFAPMSQRMPGPVSGFGGGTFGLDGKPVTTGGLGEESRWADTGQPVAGTMQPAGEVQHPDSRQEGADLSFLGQPKDGRDQAFMRMLKSDPIKALKIQSTMRDTFMNRLKGEHDFYGIAVEELGRVHDDAGWQAALQRLDPYAQALGVDLGESVPLTYPGPEGVQSLMEHALPMKEQLTYVLQQANMQADNTRADRNTDSLIADREGRRAESRRYNAARIDTTRRGQDLTNARAGRRGSGGGGKGKLGTASSPQPVKTPAEAMELPKGTHYRTPDGKVKIR